MTRASYANSGCEGSPASSVSVSTESECEEDSKESRVCSGTDGLLVRFHSSCSDPPPTEACDVGAAAPAFNNCSVTLTSGVCHDMTSSASGQQSWLLSFTECGTPAPAEELTDREKRALLNLSFCFSNMFEQDNETGVAVSPLYAVGVGLSLVSSTITNLGANIQKLALTREQKKENQRPMYRVPLWQIGFLIFVSAQGGDALALRFAPQSVVQPAGSVALLANLLFGYYLNHEPIGKLTPLALVVIILGVGLIVIFGPKGTEEWTVPEISDRWTEDEVVTYVLIMGSATITMVITLLHYDRRLERHARSARRPSQPEPGFADEPLQSLGQLSARAPGGLVPSQSMGRLTPREPPPGFDPQGCLSARERRLIKVLYPFTAAACAGWTPLLVKQTLLILSQAFTGADVAHLAATYCLPICAVCTGACQLTWLAKGLRHVEVQIMVPTFACTFTIFSIFSGSTFFEEFEGFCWERVFLFGIAVVLSLVGVFLLYQRVPSETPTETRAAATGAPAVAGTGAAVAPAAKWPTAEPSEEAGQVPPAKGAAVESPAAAPAPARVHREHDDVEDGEDGEDGGPEEVSVASVTVERTSAPQELPAETPAQDAEVLAVTV